jgi:hypothetical protein
MRGALVLALVELLFVAVSSPIFSRQFTGTSEAWSQIHVDLDARQQHVC